MKYVLTAQEMRAIEQETINKVGIDSLVLMERAALETADIICLKIPNARTALIVAGTGNNGGDGIAVGRILSQRGIETTFHLVGNPEKRTKETEKQIEIIQNLGLHIQSKIGLREYDIVVDALFGIGLSRNIEGQYQETVANINNLKSMGAMLCAIDIPSGICADTGKVLGSAVKSDITVTYGFEKRGHLLYPGKEYAGELFLRDIGIPNQVCKNHSPMAFCYEQKDILELLPTRKPSGNKGTFGKVLLIAGSNDTGGACILCGRSILQTGAGMLKIITPQCNRSIILQTMPEAMLYTYEEKPDMKQVQESMDWADVIVAGPGIGKEQAACMILQAILEKGTLPLILDADGLNLLAENESLAVLARKQKNLIITPHPGELIRLLHTTMLEYQNHRETLLNEAATEYDCTVVGKDAVTLVVQKNDEKLFINTQGNCGMATAGSGDVLAGVIGGFVAQGLDNNQAACLGVYLHGLAGMKAANAKGQYAMLASDISEFLTEMIR